MIALVDGDIVCYRIGFTTEDEDVRIAFWRADRLLQDIALDTGADELQVFISDSDGNFRKQLYPAYKANRTQPKPKHLDALKEFLIKDWDAKISIGQEADDAMGIGQTKGLEDGVETCICSIDKDLKQVPGLHWNFVNKSEEHVTVESGAYNFWKQMLTGDTTDNIVGCLGIGEVRASKLLAQLRTSPTDMEYLTLIMEQYELDFANRQKKGKPFLINGQDLPLGERVLLNGRLLHIRRKENELWDIPSMEKEEPEQATS